jgi:hypothetical protein
LSKQFFPAGSSAAAPMVRAFTRFESEELNPEVVRNCNSNSGGVTAGPMNRFTKNVLSNEHFVPHLK